MGGVDDQLLTQNTGADELAHLEDAVLPVLPRSADRDDERRPLVGVRGVISFKRFGALLAHEPDPENVRLPGIEIRLRMGDELLDLLPLLMVLALGNNSDAWIL